MSGRFGSRGAEKKVFNDVQPQSYALRGDGTNNGQGVRNAWAINQRNLFQWIVLYHPTNGKDVDDVALG